MTPSITAMTPTTSTLAASTGAATGAGASTAAPSTPTAGDGLGKDAFLKLLVAQLKYQNPMSPADSTQFLAQTAQFTMVEKLDALNKQSTQQLAASQNALAGSLIGDQVVMSGGAGADVTGVVTGMRLTADGPLLKVGGKEINLNQLKEVDKNAPAPPAAVPPTTVPPASAPTAAEPVMAPAVTAPTTPITIPTSATATTV